MQTGPGYQTSCWQLHSIQPVPGNLGSRPGPTHKSLCRRENLAHSSLGLLSPSTPGCLPICFIAGLCQDNQAIPTTTNKQNIKHKKKKREEKRRKGGERKNNSFSCLSGPFICREEKSHMATKLAWSFHSVYSNRTCHSVHRTNGLSFSLVFEHIINI